MPTYVRAIVSEDEKADVKRVQEALGMNESELVRAGLQKMGVRLDVEKPQGTPDRKVTPEIEEAVRIDYRNKMTWDELSEKYSLAKRTLNKILADEVNRIDDDKRAAIRADYLAIGYSKTQRKHDVSNTTMKNVCGDLIEAKKSK
jgi:hypothetical protein